MSKPAKVELKTILVVDDEVDICEQIVMSLELDGYTVLSAFSGNKAFDIMQKQPVDAIISDIRMADGTGIELLERLNLNGSKPNVFFFMTAHSDSDHDELKKMGADEVFSKPYDLFNVGEKLASSFTGKKSE